MKMPHVLRAALVSTILLVATVADAAPPALDSFNVDPRQTTVSGVSAGGFMAVQFHVAYSRTVGGVGVIAGGPYQCAGGNVLAALTTCTTPTPLNPPDVRYSILATEANAAAGRIDAPSDLRRSRVWLFSGTNDRTVDAVVMDRLRDYYRHWVDATQVAYERSVPAAHAMVTADFGFPCDHQGDESNPRDTFINDCRYDAAGKLLAHLYGPLKPRATALHGTFVTYRQDAFIAAPTRHSMNATGYAYVPASCDAGARCRIHVAFHGCLQYADRIGDAYVRHAGYAEWADTNDLIILFPQTTSSPRPPVYNPKGCWDWWGYDDPAYTTRDGRQMRAVKAMIDRLSAGYVATPPAPPTGLRITGTSDHGASLQWKASGGPRVARYRVYVATSAGSPSALAGTTDGTAATVSGLASGTPYVFAVRAVSRDGRESGASGHVAARTPGAAMPQAAAVLSVSAAPAGP